MICILHQLNQTAAGILGDRELLSVSGIRNWSWQNLHFKYVWTYRSRSTTELSRRADTGDRLHQRGTERQLLLTQFVFELFWIIFNGLEMKKSQSCTLTTKQRCVTDRLFFLEARPCCGVTHLWCLGYGGFGDSYNSKRRKGPTRLFIQRYKGNWRALWSWFQKQRMHLPDPSSSSVYTGTGGVVKSHA